MDKSLADTASPYNKKEEYLIHAPEPDTIAFSSYYYANNHIPSYQNRPGNNTLNKELYHKYKPEYNLYCYNCNYKK